MNRTTLSSLLELNQQFYQTFARQFASTRQRLQPGVKHILERIESTHCLLDLGCGNGELARYLAQKGHSGPYIGLDFSPSLLALASTDQPAQFKFIQANLAAPDWETSIPGFQPDFVLAFAVLHHLPGSDLRRQILIKVREMLAPPRCFIHSEWQFLSSARLKTRIQPWERIGLSSQEVEVGDYLLDWRQGGTGLRYVHHFSVPELEQLARETGFRILETFLSDGENRRLGLYQVWQASA